VALVGCAEATPKPVDFSDATRDYQQTDYPSVHERWTRHAKLWQWNVGTVIEAWATYKSWDFRQAYVAYYASIYEDSDRSALLRSQLEASRASCEFHVAVQATTDKWNDLERKNTTWRVTLLDATGAELGPTSIQAVKLPELYESHLPARQVVAWSCGLLARWAASNWSGTASSGPGSQLCLDFSRVSWAALA
jgi:hypothetical protein